MECWKIKIYQKASDNTYYAWLISRDKTAIKLVMPGQSKERMPSEQGIFNRLLTRFTDESIDALDTSQGQFFERLIPGMRPEHTLRYTFAAQQLEEMGIEGQPVIVDAATGKGYGTKIIKEIIPSAKIFGVDLNPKTIRYAYNKYGLYGEYVQADVRRLPVGDSKVDLVAAFETLEHLPPEDQPVFLQELKRITKPNGRIVLSVPYPSSTYRGRNNGIKHGFGSGFHLYEPTAQETREMIQDAGLTIAREFGQVITSSREAKIMSIVNRVVPIWGIYSWLPERDRNVEPIPNKQNITSLIHIFVAKPSL